MLLLISFEHNNRWEVYSFKQVEFIRKIVQEVAKLKDIRNFFNSQKEADIPAFVAYATDDVSESEVLIVGKWDKNINPSKKKKKKNPHHQCPRKYQSRGWNICYDS